MTRRTPPPPRRGQPLRSRPGASPRSRTAARPRGGIAPLPAIVLGVFAVLAVGLFVGVMAVYASYASSLPDASTIDDITLDQGSRVVSADGVELASFAHEDRRAVTFDQIPEIMREAQVSAEDQTFWTNPCIDFRGIARAFWQNLTLGREVSGASTICQQLVRSRLFDAALLTPERRVERKIKEAMLALRVGEQYGTREGKEQLLAMYMNQIYYGNNAYGIWAAAEAYFGKDITKDDQANQLTISEAAMLASLVRSPSSLDPSALAVEQKGADGKTRLVVPEDARAQLTQGFVLDRMLADGYITQAQHDEAADEPVVLAKAQNTRFKAPHFVYAVRREAAELLGDEELLDRAGLTISTTLNYDGYQTSAEKWAAIGYDMDRLSDEQLTKKYGKDALRWIKQLQGRNINNDALVTLNYRTGAVLAYVGSSNYYGRATD
ncbi:MAG TPA: transglycosylase domain-containing protein, partial [Candidatus Limnocylindria bacterium]|nr:transglycosylase domain-containing protein [Candidatus Limnocylindria bacterium]